MKISVLSIIDWKTKSIILYLRSQNLKNSVLLVCWIYFVLRSWILYLIKDFWCPIEEEYCRYKSKTWMYGCVRRLAPTKNHRLCLLYTCPEIFVFTKAFDCFEHFLFFYWKRFLQYLVLPYYDDLLLFEEWHFYTLGRNANFRLCVIHVRWKQFPENNIRYAFSQKNSIHIYT